MTKILTVDDSRAVRMIVSKHARELGFEVEEAEDGEQALLKMEEDSYDLVILDITMPILDGPGTLSRMRAVGNNTPVVMLTSESKRSIIADLMKSGITDYILKPFKPAELQTKILKALKLEGRAPTPAALAAGGATAEAPARAEAAATSADAGAAKPFVDILVIDDMENVQKRLRTLIPEHLSLNGALSAPAGLATCRERVFRVVLIDADIPEISAAALMRQCRLLQPHAAFLSLALRTNNDVQKEAREAGFDGVMFKPFNTEALEDFLLKYFDNQEAVSQDNHVVRVTPFKGREARIAGYFVQLGTLLNKCAERVAEACFSHMVLDISGLPPVPEKVARLVIDTNERTQKMGIDLRLVAPPELAKILRQVSDTADVVIFATVAEADAGKAAA
jgi:two-component system cell cycle response regulator